MTLGMLIARLEEANPEHSVYLDFARCAPTTFASYRGFYDEIAVGFSDNDSTTVAQLLARAQGALGQTFQGWKGGDYVMTDRTPVWVANDGNASGTKLVKVVVGDRCVTLLTDTEQW